MDAAQEWFAWFETIGEHITSQGSAVSNVRQLGNVDGSQTGQRLHRDQRPGPRPRVADRRGLPGRRSGLRA